MENAQPTNKDLEKLILEHTEDDNERFATLATKADIDSMRESFNARLTKQDEAIAPAIEIITGLGKGRQFIVWIIPVFIFIGMVIAFIRKV